MNIVTTVTCVITVTSVTIVTSDTTTCYNLASTNTGRLSLFAYRPCNKDDVDVVALSPRGLRGDNTTPQQPSRLDTQSVGKNTLSHLQHYVPDGFN